MGRACAPPKEGGRIQAQVKKEHIPDGDDAAGEVSTGDFGLGGDEHIVNDAVERAGQLHPSELEVTGVERRVVHLHKNL